MNAFQKQEESAINEHLLFEGSRLNLQALYLEITNLILQSEPESYSLIEPESHSLIEPESYSLIEPESYSLVSRYNHLSPYLKIRQNRTSKIYIIKLYAHNHYTLNADNQNILKSLETLRNTILTQHADHFIISVNVHSYIHSSNSTHLQNLQESRRLFIHSLL